MTDNVNHPSKRDCPYCQYPYEVMDLEYRDRARINRSVLTGQPTLAVYELYTDRLVNMPINYCPMCGRKLIKMEEA